jgi:sortase A
MLLCVLLAAVVLSYGSAKVETKHYQNGEISFDYPASWQQLSAQKNQVAVFQDPESGLNVTITRQFVPPGYTPPQNFVPYLFSGVKSDFKPVSQQTININGTTAYDNLYKINANGTALGQRELWVQKNGAVYSIIFKYPQGGSKSTGNNSGSVLEAIESINPFNSNQASSDFDVVKKSLSISPAQLSSNPVFGSVSIPSLKVKWDIRYDTLNAYNAVYHYSESFYPGQNGAMGLLGHHTLYSAPFNHVELIQPGYIVIINDYLTQKKYTYQVVSNNDIRYDYTVNTIKFPQGKNELILGTCWPPGSTAAERYVHCQLISVEPLN